MGLFNLLSTKDYVLGQNKLKEDIRVTINEATAELKASVEALLGRVDELVGPLQEANTALSDTIAREREEAAILAGLEDQEDVEQNAALADARAETDSILQSQSAAVDEINALRANVDSALAADEPTAPIDPVE